jgi:hypothetical protein
MASGSADFRSWISPVQNILTPSPCDWIMQLWSQPKPGYRAQGRRNRTEMHGYGSLSCSTMPPMRWRQARSAEAKCLWSSWTAVSDFSTPLCVSAPVAGTGRRRNETSSLPKACRRL